MVFTENCYMCSQRLLSKYVQECSMYLSLLVCLHTQSVCFCPCVCVFLTVFAVSLSLSGPVSVSQHGWYGFGSTRLFRSSFERWGRASQRKADGAAAKWTQITTEPNEFSLITIHPTPRSTPRPRTTHANTTPLTHTIKTPQTQASTHTRMQTHQPLQICSSAHIHAHKLFQHPSMSPEYDCVCKYIHFTMKTCHAACFSRQIKVAPCLLH